MEFPRDKQESLIKIAQQMEHPFYCYNMDAFHNHLQELTKCSNQGVRLWYATKANPLSCVVDEIIESGAGIDVASLGELEHCLNRGAGPEKILATGPAKSRTYLQKLLQKGVRIIVCEGLNQLSWLQEIAQAMKLKVQILLRIQLDWEQFSMPNQKSVLGGSNITPFGLPPQEWAHIRPEQYPNLHFRGMHIFQWANILCSKTLMHIWKISARECTLLAKQMNFNLEVLDLGGGLGIPYSKGQSKPCWQEAQKALGEIREEYAFQEIWLELGRYAIGEFGHYLTKVIDRKRVRGKNLLVLEGGINQLARPTLTKEPFPCQALPRKHGELSSEMEHFQVHGPLCTSLDLLGEYTLPKDVDVDDWLIFNQTGAYGFTESMPFFLCHPLPGEVILQCEKIKVLRAGKSASSWLA